MKSKKIVKSALVENPFIPTDKSISHRAIMISSIANGNTIIENFLMSDDCIRTIDCFKKMGVDIQVDIDSKRVIVRGVGKNGLKKPIETLDCGNSGTTARIMMGVLAGQNFECELTGDNSLTKRPMGRVVEPLKKFGVKFEYEESNQFLPLKLCGVEKTDTVTYEMEVKSAQVKSALLLAGLYSDKTVIVERNKTRNHTELMLKQFGCDINEDGEKITIKNSELKANNIKVPKDISSALFIIVYILVSEYMDVTLSEIGMNETRSYVIDFLISIGADIEIIKDYYYGNERVCDIRVRSSEIEGFVLDEDDIYKLIDEIPILMVLATFAKNKSVILDAKELRIKESDRLKAMCDGLNAVFPNVVRILDEYDGVVINPNIKSNKNLTNIKTYGDHRIAMSFAILGFLDIGNITIDDEKCIDVSFPNFFENFI